MGARGQRRRSQARQAQTGEEIPAHAGQGRHLPEWRHSLDRLSRLRALHPRHRHQSRQDQPHQDRPEDRRGRANVRAAGVVNLRSSKAMLRPLTPAAIKAMLGDGGELALIDLREELIFSRSHLLWARSLPLSRLELHFARLVPRKTTRTVLVDDNDGLTARAARVLADAGY